MIQKYVGTIGNFQYDDAEFQINEEGHLKYIGSERDGRNIDAPVGLIDATELFENVGLTHAANLPDTVTKMDRCYNGCSDMVDGGKIPPHTDSINSAYAHTAIQVTPFMPDSVTDAGFAFDHCLNLEKCGNFSKRLKNADCMFAGDENLVELPEELPAELKSMDGFACNCTNLRVPPKTSKSVRNMNNAYASCLNLEVAPEIPEGASSENVTVDCYTLENPGTFGEAEKVAAKPFNREVATAEATSGIEVSGQEHDALGLE